ncbi:cell divisionFtsK/SpoIIIE [Beutenbergia cavernae DSM 12333]|uniref:Cell divisionFtsK/SpoIIIE n=1 Tax=Beutenbergia cavernae (strain ATCC BAA-8 / DSM 12333 / CCUG 43141 / JCM 11478 / NBRC 16432 / NCIMB 13614 / HKI 0122) TaxID=471853 RepID=C5BYH1_BEUC1|nr:FtsK/SpoIIIE domain-containing protein [Beutenbergia cavernae]ACQ81071.1 cell divisionFtsK/SpoIIIE [Beutenbergia cavernae DSM 12333]
MTNPAALLPACWSTPWHLAVVDGPDVGWCLPIVARARVVGRGVDADLTLEDPALSRRHVAVRLRGDAVQVRDLASANGTRALLPPRRPRRPRRADAAAPTSRGPAPGRTRRRRAGRAWRIVPPGTVLVAGGSRLEVRARPGRAAPDPPRPDAGLPVARLVTPLLMGLMSVPLLLSSVGSGPLPAWRLALLVAVPALLVVSVVAAVVGHRRERGRDPELPTPDPPTAPPDPPALALLAVRGGPLPEASGMLDVGTETIELDDAASLALVGAPAAVAAMARWVDAQLRLAGRTARVLVASSWHEVPADAGRVVEVGERHVRRVSAGWAEAIVAHLGRPAAPELPATVPLTDLLGARTGPEVLAAWRSPSGTLAAPIGVGAHGPHVLDLAADGPHALVAGTTGAGKSELLLAWILALTATHPPRDLALVLVDYKGGATFAAVADLPHVTGVLTDLDAAATGRALASLRAELRRRERAFALVGARDLPQYRARDPAERVSRLLVVVDEFRTLATELPGFVDGLVRLAAQGRSLGIHLVLATQRPAGAVTAEMRANIGVRICLRVLSSADSLDVVDAPDAAELPAAPGRALVRTTGLSEIQAAWSGGEHDGGPIASAVRHAARLAGELGHGELVDVRTPWAPPLPVDVRRPDVPGVLVTDLPEEQRLGTWSWEGAPLLVTGGPGSGRSTALASLLGARVRAGDHAHVIGRDLARLCPAVGLARGDHPTLGTVVGPEDPRRLARLVTVLESGGARPGTVLVVDDVETATEALDRVGGPGAGTDRLVSLLRRSASLGLRIAVAGAAPGTRWSALVRHHLALGVRDAGSAALAGIPRELVGVALFSGRGVLLGPDGPLAVQVVRDDGAWPTGGGAATPRLHALPDVVDLAALPPSDGEGLVIGVGGDDAGHVRVPLLPGRPWLVVGSPATGRTGVLDMVADLLGDSRRVVRVDPGTQTLPDSPPGVTWLVDDAESLLPEVSDALATLLAGRRERCVVVTTGEAAASSYRGVLAVVRDARTVLLLGSAAGSPAAGVDTRAARDPVLGHLPGRGVLVIGGRASPVQIARVGGSRR